MLALWLHHANSPLQWGAVIGASLAAAVIDLKGWKIPNRLTGPLCLAGLVQAAWFGGIPGLGDGLAGCVLLALPYVVLFIVAGGGAGDAKLMGAIGAWLGIHDSVAVLLAVSVCGALLGIGFAMVTGRFRDVRENLTSMVCALFFLVAGRRKLRDAPGLMPDADRMLKMPYGVSIFAGVCVAALGVFICRT